MPEGNTIHRFALDHTRDLAGRVVRVRSPQGRFAREARRLDGRVFARADAHGKHLFHFWEGSLVVHVHLGLAGDFHRHEGRAPRPRPTVRMRLSTDAVAIDLIGPPTCELIEEEERLGLLARLGPDPLRADADPGLAWRKLTEIGRPIGDALLDQRVLSGVGNIYRNEALFLIGVHPLLPSNGLGAGRWRKLWDTLAELMRRGVSEGRTATVSRAETPHPRAAREPDDGFYVYGHRICRRCGRKIRELSLSGRRMFACPGCQPAAARRPPPRKSSPGHIDR